MRLKPKLALFILPVILLQIIILIIPSLLRYQDYVTDKMKGHIGDSIERVENALHTQLGDMQADSLLFSRSSIVNKYIRVEDEEVRFNLLHNVVLGEFTSFMEAHPEYIEISLLALDGYEEVSLHHQQIRNLSDQEQETLYFKNIVKSSADYEITPLINPDTGQWTWVLARKIFQKNLIEQSLSTPQEVKGYLIVKMNFDFLDYLFKYNSLLDNGFMMIHSANGVPIILKGDSEVVSMPSLLEKLTATTGSAQLQIKDWLIDNKSYIVGQKQLVNGLICSIGWSDSALDDLLKNIAYSSVMSIFIVTMLTGVVLFWLLNKLLIKPILELGRAAKIMGKGKGKWLFRSTSQDELSELGNSIQEMGMNLITQKQKIHEIAYIDSLTNLPNRRQFTDELSHQYLFAERKLPNVALLFIDLDGFKQVNDTCGHEAGDLLLVIVAKRLKNVLRTNDNINYIAGACALTQHHIARFGGDEFTVLLRDITDRKSVIHIVKRILHELSRSITVADREFVIGASIGIAIAGESGENAAELLKNADAAMYEAKIQGKNTYRFFSKSAAIKSFQIMEMREDLRRAINNKELTLVYQPQICAKSGKMVACEALVRWKQAGKGWISPDVFIPVAEQSGLIVSLGRWVLREACRQVKEWQITGYATVPVWVNVSSVQLAKDDMYQVIMTCLAETGLSANALAVEVTESSIMQGKDSIIQLEKIQAQGVRIAMDDFGTGYSSLSALRGLPINELKIDKSFVNDLINGAEGKAIVSAIIAMAHQLHLQVIAEGVETLDQLDFLKLNGVDIIQGYYFSKPLPPEVFMERLRTNSLDKAFC